MNKDRIYLSAPCVGKEERELILDAFDSNWIAPLGPHVDAFEMEMAEKVGVRTAAALSSGTAAVDLALRLVGVQRGDRVLASTLTFIGSVGPIVHLGADPVFVDSDWETWNMDPDLLAEELNRSAEKGVLPSAIVVTDVYGQCSDYDRLEPLCAKYAVPLIEDAAEAFGATWNGRSAGSFGRCATLSFNGNKIVTTSGGGMIVSNDEDLVRRARHLSTQARIPALHYEHEEVGFNYRLSNLCAAVGRGQLKRLEDNIARRREISDIYRSRLGDIPGVTFNPICEQGFSNYWLTVALIEPRVTGVDSEKVLNDLGLLNIEARPAWKPMHLQPAFRDAQIVGGSVAEEIFRLGLCLPSGSGLDNNQIDAVVDGVLGALHA